MSKQKTALITGVNGQDGAYLSQLLLDKSYMVHGVIRRSSSYTKERLDAFGLGDRRDFTLHYGDLSDANALTRIISETQPDEIYNLAAQSDVGVSFDVPEYTADTVALGTLRVLESIRILGLEGKTRMYQASSSELFGASPAPQNEDTPFYPVSPYASAKLYAYWICRNYRDAYDIFVSNGVLFNHESPLRGERFVTRKISMAVARIADGLQECLEVGNLEAKRDWGHARDYVEGMWRMLNHDVADDFVLATGQSHTVREFVVLAFQEVGIEISWSGKGRDEIGVDRDSGKTLIKIDPKFFRPNEVRDLRGDAGKAKAILGWEPRTSFEDLVKEMVQADLEGLKP